VLAAQQVHNTCWKESRGVADWVIYTAIDEFLYAPDLKAYLTECTRQKVTVIPALGYQMIAATFPTADQSLLDLVQRGCPFAKMNKLSLFNPNKIIETNQLPGRHSAEPIGEVRYPAKDVVLNLHYKYLSFEHTVKRHLELEQKLGKLDKENNWGYHYSWTQALLKTDWDYFEQHAVENIFAPDYDPHVAHSPLTERWWRQGPPPSAPPQRLEVVGKQIGRGLFQLWLKIPERARNLVKKLIPEKFIVRLLNYLLYNRPV
jgi:hypothetical protein